MNCKRVQRLLSEHIDGRLSGRATWEIDLHLAQCNRCTEIANELRKTIAVAQAARRCDAPTGFAARVQQRLAESPPPSRRQPVVEIVRAALRPKVLPAWAAVPVLTILALTLRHPADVRPAPAAQAGARIALHSAGYGHIALTAAGPLDDVSASVLESHYAQDLDAPRSADPEPQD